MSKRQTYALLAGMIGGAILALSAGTLTRDDVLAPVLAVGLAAPLGWAGMELLERVRTRQDESPEHHDVDR